MTKPIYRVLRDVRFAFIVVMLALAGLVASTAHAGGVTILTAGYLSINNTALTVSATTAPTAASLSITSAGNVAWVPAAPTQGVNGNTVFVKNTDSADTITITVGTTVAGPACALAPLDNAIMQYDSTTSKWRVMACNTAAGAGPFLKLDASNSPVTGQLAVGSGVAARTNFQVNGDAITTGHTLMGNFYAVGGGGAASTPDVNRALHIVDTEGTANSFALDSLLFVTPSSGALDFFGTRFQSAVTTGNSTAINILRSINAITTAQGSGTVSRESGIGGYSATAGTANVSQAYGLSGGVSTAGTGVMTDGVAIIAEQPTVVTASTITNAYGVYIKPQTIGTTLNYGLYYDSGALPTVITGAGRVGIGTGTPGVALDVVGAITDSGNTTLGDAGADTVTSNAAAWTFANDTNFTLSGGVNGLSFDGTTFSVDSTNHRVGFGTAAPSHFVDIQAGTLAASVNALNVAATLTTGSSTPLGVVFTVTPSASTGSVVGQQTALMGTSYVSTGTTTSMLAYNQVPGTGVGGLNGNAVLGINTGAADYGLLAAATMATPTVGHVIGVSGLANGSSVLNVGVGGVGASDNVANPGIGVYGTTGVGAVSAGGFFTLRSSPAVTVPVIGATVALVADNGNIAANIFSARDNGTPVFTIADGGGTTITTTLAVNGNATLGDATSDLTTVNGDVKFVAGTPTFTTGTCSATSGTGNDIHGTITGTCTAATAIVHYSSTKSVAPDCQVTPKNAAAAATITTMTWVSSTTDLTITQATATTAGIWGYSCFQ